MGVTLYAVTTTRTETPLAHGRTDKEAAGLGLVLTCADSFATTLDGVRRSVVLRVEPVRSHRTAGTVDVLGLTVEVQRQRIGQRLRAAVFHRVRSVAVAIDVPDEIPIGGVVVDRVRSEIQDVLTLFIRRGRSICKAHSNDGVTILTVGQSRMNTVVTVVSVTW